MSLDPIGLGSGASPLRSSPSSTGGEHFADALTRMLRDVNRDQLVAKAKIENLVVEGKGSIHDAMVAMTKAEGSFRLLMQMRNRIVEGVNELLRTQV